MKEICFFVCIILWGTTLIKVYSTTQTFFFTCSSQNWFLHSVLYLIGKIFGIHANYIIAEVQFREGEDAEEEAGEV